MEDETCSFKLYFVVSVRQRKTDAVVEADLQAVELLKA